MMETNSILKEKKMPRFGTLANGKIGNVFLADTLEDAQKIIDSTTFGFQAVELPDEVGVHWAYDGTTFTKPEQE